MGIRTVLIVLLAAAGAAVLLLREREQPEPASPPAPAATAGPEKVAGAQKAPGAQEAPPLRIKLPASTPDRFVEGRVVEAGSNRPLDGAVVRVRRGRSIVAESRTHEDGNFRIGVPAEIWEIEAESRGFYRIRVGGGRFEGADRVFRLRSADDPEGGAAKLTVELRRPDGRFAEDAEVLVRTVGPDPESGAWDRDLLTSSLATDLRADPPGGGDVGIRRGPARHPGIVVFEHLLPGVAEIRAFAKDAGGFVVRRRLLPGENHLVAVLEPTGTLTFRVFGPPVVGRVRMSGTGYEDEAILTGDGFASLPIRWAEPLLHVVVLDDSLIAPVGTPPPPRPVWRGTFGPIDDPRLDRVYENSIPPAGYRAVVRCRDQDLSPIAGVEFEIAGVRYVVGPDGTVETGRLADPPKHLNVLSEIPAGLTALQRFEEPDAAGRMQIELFLVPAGEAEEIAPGVTVRSTPYPDREPRTSGRPGPRMTVVPGSVPR